MSLVSNYFDRCYSCDVSVNTSLFLLWHSVREGGHLVLGGHSAPKHCLGSIMIYTGGSVKI